MEQGVRQVLRNSFYSSLKIPNNVVKPFSTSGIWFFQKVLYVLFLWFDALWGNCSSEKVNFCCKKMTFVHCQLKAGFLNAFEGCSQVGNEVISIISCDADIVHILGTLVRFDNFIKVFPHKTGKCGQCSTEALCQTSVSECATGKTEGQHFN